MQYCYYPTIAVSEKIGLWNRLVTKPYLLTNLLLVNFVQGVTVYTLNRSPQKNEFLSPWAIKKISKHKVTTEIKKRLKDEAHILCNLKHPNIVGFRAFIPCRDGSDCLAMEECDTSLGDLIEKRNEDDLGPFAPRNIVDVGMDISKALDYLHNEALLMHCDIKSYNILIKGNFLISKLCDFGVCLPVNKEGCLDKEKAGEEAEYVGTPVWCAPEVLKYPQEVTTKADIYSFGLVFWEMLSLMPPVDESVAETSFDISSDLDDESFCVPSAERQRPSLPDITLGKEYDPILEIFYCCTENDLSLRPSANHLKLYFEKEKEELH